MHRKFIAIVLGAALAVTGLSSAPVRAQDRGETAAIIAGVAALTIIGVAVANDRKKGHRKDYVSRNHGHNYKHQNRHYKQKRYHRQERRQRHHSNNRVYRAQPAYNNRGHQTRRNTQRGAERYSAQSRHRRDHNGK
ncbi:MAG: hypothetical protein RQ750_10375 [Roseovarius sp.]|nr:hypothetical protein [Roseovarius sp.]